MAYKKLLIFLKNKIIIVEDPINGDIYVKFYVSTLLKKYLGYSIKSINFVMLA